MAHRDIRLHRKNRLLSGHSCQQEPVNNIKCLHRWHLLYLEPWPDSVSLYLEHKQLPVTPETKGGRLRAVGVVKRNTTRLVRLGAMPKSTKEHCDCSVTTG